MIQKIGGRPTANIRHYIWKPSPEKRLPFPFSHPRKYFHFSARYALAAGIQALGLKPGDAVLLPAYNCGVEIEPFHHLGIRTEFYRIDKHLHADLDDIHKRLDGSIKAVMATHYLGFPQQIEEIRKQCDDYGIFLIEDCAHALLSSHNGRPLGTYGDIAVFSLLKTLPVPNGGLMVINNEEIQWQHEARRPSRFSALFYIADLLRQKTTPRCSGTAVYERIGYTTFWSALNAIKLVLAATKKACNLDGLYLARPDSFAFRNELIGWGVSTATMHLIGNTDFDLVREARRKNFSYLLDCFSVTAKCAASLPVTKLPEGVCPLFFPIIIDQEGKREQLYRSLKTKGITSHPWWDSFHSSVRWEDYQDARYLKEKLLGLPVHQDLTEKMLSHLVSELTSKL